MDTSLPGDQSPARSVHIRRLVIGFAQGLLLWLLYRAAQKQHWPATTPYLFVPLALIGAFVPALAVSGLANLRRATLSFWLGGASALAAAVGAHQVGRDQLAGLGLKSLQATTAIPAVAALALALFILHVLVVAADLDGKPIAAYRTYFDTAWKHQVQLLLSLAFLGAFWAVLWLGAGLFALIGVGFLARLIALPFFMFAASAVAFSYAVSVTDVRVRLIEGMRNLLHVLLSWLLPLATVLIIGFIALLPFTGLARLWRTTHGSELLLAAVAALILLINTAYRDGEDPGRPVLLQRAGSAAALCLPVLVAISAYGLALRIEDRGWTNYRVVGLAFVIVAASYALGYGWAALASGPWLKRLEATNVVGAGLIIVAVVALTTPLADPSRLSVAGQVARLQSGRTSPDQFDFKYLRFYTARYGRQALERLRTAEGPNSETIRERAQRAHDATSPYAAARPTLPSPTELAAMPVFPAGRSLPDSFAQQDWQGQARRYSLPQCLVNAALKCEAIIVESGGGEPAIIVYEVSGARRGMLFQQQAGAEWSLVGPVSTEIRCENVRQALRSGEYRWVASQQQELEVAGERLAVSVPRKPPTCR